MAGSSVECMPRLGLRRETLAKISEECIVTTPDIDMGFLSCWTFSNVNIRLP